MDVLSEHGALASWGDAIDEDSQSNHAGEKGTGAPVNSADAAILDALAGDSRQGINLMFKQVRVFGGRESTRFCARAPLRAPRPPPPPRVGGRGRANRCARA